MKMHTRTTLLTLCATLLASTLTFGDMFSVVDDTWVREDNADSNRNGDDQINARTDLDGPDNDVILLRFDISSLSAPAVGSTLNLSWFRDDTSTSNSLSLWGLNDSAPGETSWLESTVTYNTAPGLIPDNLDVAVELANSSTYSEIQDLDLANLTLIVDQQAYGPQVTNEIYSFTSASLTDFINADTNGQVTFLILRGNESTSGNQARFQVKEVGTGAVLDVAVPEPATFALLAGLGVLGFALWRRRR